MSTDKNYNKFKFIQPMLRLSLSLALNALICLISVDLATDFSVIFMHVVIAIIANLGNAMPSCLWSMCYV